MNDLRQIWDHVTGKHSRDPGQIETFWREIVNSYSNPSRAYHNLDHIQYLIDQAIEFQSELEDFDAIVMAIVYHDIIYNIGRKDNEENSSALAKFRLGEMEFPSHIIERCNRHILATKEHLVSSVPDTNWMVDFDLAILGEDEGSYKLYREKLRSEYAAMSDAEFNKGRVEMIKSFLKRERIYATDEYYGRYEERARENLKNELEKLFHG